MNSQKQSNPDKTSSQLEWRDISKFLKDYGFIMENAQIYGGLTSNYDYGPFGHKLKTKIKSLWWNYFVDSEILVHGLDSAILTHSKVLKASGHLDKFSDWILICQNCQDQSDLEEIIELNQNEDQIEKKINKLKPKCFNCQKDDNWRWTKHNLLFQTHLGVQKEKAQIIFLRPETAQGVFTNFKKIIQTLKIGLPFGIAQTGKVFRNELTTQYANFRTCEFEQMEMQFFSTDRKQNDFWFAYWEKKTAYFLTKILKINPKMIKTRNHSSTELAHYALKTIDFEYQFPFGWKEIWGLSDRGQYDVKTHHEMSNENLFFLDQNQKNILPFVVEPSGGVERLMLALIADKLIKNDGKFTLQLPFNFCYYHIAVLPLTEKLLKPTQKIFDLLSKKFSVRLDHKKTIGKRYLFHDAIGTFFCITFDFNSLDDQAVTVRHRDSKKQNRIKIKDLITYCQKWV